MKTIVQKPKPNLSRKPLVLARDLKYKSVNGKKPAPLVKSSLLRRWDKKKRLLHLGFGAAWACEINSPNHQLSNAQAWMWLFLKIEKDRSSNRLMNIDKSFLFPLSFIRQLRDTTGMSSWWVPGILKSDMSILLEATYIPNSSFPY